MLIFVKGAQFTLGVEVNVAGWVLSRFRKPAMWFNGAKSRQGMCENGLGMCGN
jgi:hypothetical protein